MTLHGLTQPVVFGLQIINAGFGLLQQSGLLCGGSIGSCKLRGKFCRFLAGCFEVCSRDCQL